MTSNGRLWPEDLQETLSSRSLATLASNFLLLSLHFPLFFHFLLSDHWTFSLSLLWSLSEYEEFK